MFSFRTQPIVYLLIFLLSANCSFAVIRYVNINNPTPGAGTSWATAFTDLNAALAASLFPAHYGDTIWVAKGTYKPTITTNRSATFLCTFGYCVYGGFDGTETSFSQRNPNVNVTILSGDIGVPGDASDNSYHVVTLKGYQGGRDFDGFTIRDGNANAGYPGSTTPQADNSGGGVLELALANDVSRADLKHCFFTNNFAVYGGGFCSYGDGTSAQSHFNIATLRFDNNTAVFGGAMAAVAINLDWAGPVIQNCIFTNNTSLTGQGSVFACVVDNPYAGVNSSMENCVLYNNAAPQIFNQVANGVSNVTLNNDIIWTSGAPYAGPLSSGPTINFQYCDLDLVTPLGGTGNLDADPLFVNGPGNDFHLTICSPCIDMGNSITSLNTDYDGNVRPQGAAKDIGAYEYAGASSIPAAPTVTSPSICQNVTATALTATGTNLLWYTAATGGIGSATAPVPSTAAAGATTWYVTQTSAAGCESIRSPITVTIKSSPAAPTATSPSYCQNAAATALTATGSNKLWYTVAVNGVGSSTAPVPSTATAGTTTWYVTQTVSGCESTRTPVVVTVGSAAAAPTATAISYCQNAAATALTATGSNLLWYTVAVNGVGNSTAPVPSTTALGSTTWYVTQTPAGNCESARTPLTVTIKSVPAVPTATSTVYCQNDAATALTATGSNLLWYTVAVNGVGVSTAPVPSTASAGATTWYVTQTPAGSCESARIPVTVTIKSVPAAPTAASPNYCLSATATALTATGSNLLWYTVATNGVGNATAPVPSTTSAGATTWYVTQTPAGSCESARTPVTVTVGSPASAPTASSLSYCQNATAAALTATGSNLLWYTVATGTGSATAPVPSTTSVGTTTWYVTQTPAGSCESAQTPVTVTINSVPAEPTAASVTYCQNDAAGVLTATGSNLLWYTTAAGGTGDAAAPTPSTATAGTTTYYVVSQTSGCESSRKMVTVTVNGLPQVSISPVTGSLCVGGSVTLNASGAATYQWSPATGLSDAAGSNPVATLTNDVLYTVTGTGNNGCINTAQISLKPAITCLGYNIPDAFTPNGDGHNDLFRVVTADAPQSFHMTIFNRYGGKVFETSDIQAGWNGTMGSSPPISGAFVYTIVIKTSAGTTIEKKGTVLVIR